MIFIHIYIINRFLIKKYVHSISKILLSDNNWIMKSSVMVFTITKNTYSVFIILVYLQKTFATDAHIDQTKTSRIWMVGKHIILLTNYYIASNMFIASNIYWNRTDRKENILSSSYVEWSRKMTIFKQHLLTWLLNPVMDYQLWILMHVHRILLTDVWYG